MSRATFVLMLSLPMFGCGKSGRLPTYPASGTVTYEDGQMVEEGTVLLVAEGLTPGRALIENGKFKVGTYEEADGAVEGSFQVGVLVSPPIDYDPDSGKPPVGAKAKYERPETSGIVFDVQPDGPNELDIKLERGR